MKLKVSKKAIAEDEGIVYVLLTKMEDKDLVKIGITTRSKIEDRVVEILSSAFKKYREFFYCYPKRFTKTTDIFAKEAMLHRYFDDRRYETKHKFGGCTEMFDVPLDEVVDAYERVLAGENLDEVQP